MAGSTAGTRLCHTHSPASAPAEQEKERASRAPYTNPMLLLYGSVKKGFTQGEERRVLLQQRSQEESVKFPRTGDTGDLAK